VKEYHKIQSVYMRDPANNHKTFVEGEWAMPEFGYLAHLEWEWSEKVDGTNIRVMRTAGEAVSFGGKTDRASIPAKLVDRLRERFGAPDALLPAFPDTVNVCLYGEGYGAGIQSGGNYRQDQDFVLFDVWVNGWWLRRADVEEIAAKLGLDVAPIIGRGTLPEMVEVARAGFASQFGTAQSEGIVARPSVDLFTRSGERIITKVKHRDFPR
jgi:ATP-dependent RNA circularization protein (DNA/RNA ligase family)